MTPYSDRALQRSPQLQQTDPFTRQFGDLLHEKPSNPQFRLVS